MENIKVIGIMGLIGSGKDSISEHISKKYGYKIFSTGTSGVIGEVTYIEGLPLTRKNLQMISEKYRQKYGMDYFAKLTLQKIIDSEAKKSLIKDLRKPEDITIPKNYFGKNMIVIFIDSDPNVRFERLLKRSSARDPKTFEEFQQNEKREHELYFSKSLGMHDYKIENNGSKEELYEKINDLLKRIGFE